MHVVARDIEVEAVPDGTLVVDVVVAGQHDHRAVESGELIVDEVDVGVVDTVVVEQVAGDQKEVGIHLARRIDDAGECPFGAAAESVGCLVGVATVQVHVGCVHDGQGSLHEAERSLIRRPRPRAARRHRRSPA